MSEGDPERTGEMTIAELLERLSGQTSRLVRQEAALAREELMTKASRAGMGTMLFGTAGVIAVYGVGAVVAGIVAALATGLPPWASALIIGVALLPASGVMVALGRRRLRRVFPLTPKTAAERLKADAGAIVESARK
jgi:Putative Actinobacterial Holin-X, holin superfamily III